MDKPEDIPQDVWDAARKTAKMASAPHNTPTMAHHLVARAIIKARNDALEGAAKAIDVMREVEHDREWLILGEAAQAIRNLKHEGER